MKKNNLNRATISLALSMFFGVAAFGGSCDTKLFDITSQGDGLTISDVVGQFAKECRFSVITKDRFAEQKLKMSLPSMNLNSATLKDVLRIVLEENGLSHSFDGQLLRISYLSTKTFKVDFIATTRYGHSNTNVNISTDQTTTTSTTSVSTANTGKSATATTSFDDYVVWESLKSEINQILTRPDDDFSALILRSKADRDGEYGAKYPVIRDDERGVDNQKWDSLHNSAFGLTASGTKSNSETKLEEINGRSDVIESRKYEKVSFGLPEPIINKGAGLVTVTGSKKQIERVEEYINSLTSRLKNQVIIDVSILTVLHSDGMTTGIDWNQLYNLQNFRIKSESNFIQSVTETEPKSKLLTNIDSSGQVSMTNVDLGTQNTWTTKGALSVFGPEISLNRVVEFLKNYGEVSSVSNPKVMTLNNQPALISVGNIIRYKKVTTLQTTSTGGTNTNSNEEYPSVFAGVLLDITPSIYNGEIMLKINPSITKTKGIDVETASQALDRPPNLSTNQLSSVVKVKNGEKVILGGLINKENSTKENKVPLLGDIPILGYAFKHEANTEKTEEMVIIITPRIVEKEDGISLRDLGYKKVVNE